MKRLLILLIMIVPLAVSAQLLSPSKWQQSISAQEVKKDGTVDLIFSVTIEQDWYLYGTGENPPHLQVSFEENDSYKLVGSLKEGAGAKKKYDDLLEIDVKYFEKKAEFRQTVKILKENPVITVEFNGQVCSQVSGQCVPVRKSFTFDNIKVTASNTSSSDLDKVKASDSSKKDPVKTTQDKNGKSTNTMSISELETERDKLITKDANGKDESVEYLKKFATKYGAKK